MTACAAEGEETRLLHADHTFHSSLVRRGGNHLLRSVMENIRGQFFRFGLKISGEPKNFSDISAEQAGILESLGGTNKRKAVHAMRRHLVATEDRLP